MCRREKGKRRATSWRIFSLKELHSATNNFNYDNKLGEGSFGSVYWGQLSDGTQVVFLLSVPENLTSSFFSVLSFLFFMRLISLEKIKNLLKIFRKKIRYAEHLFCKHLCWILFVLLNPTDFAFLSS